MGNRANVVFVAGERVSPCVYLHWNGGPESVYAFLEELERRDVRADADYECARFTQLVGEFFDSSGARGGGLSLGIVSVVFCGDWIRTLERVGTDHGDNGFYVVDRTTGHVRRFAERVTGSGRVALSELSPADVAAERAGAEAHAYRDGIREFFDELELHRLEFAAANA
jgi:hypothetical protein